MIVNIFLATGNCLQCKGNVINYFFALCSCVVVLFSFLLILHVNKSSSRKKYSTMVFYRIVPVILASSIFARNVHVYCIYFTSLGMCFLLCSIS